VAENLGIDLIWFGILMAVNMQTSFMHPPFGFALFYLRSVAPFKAYRDHVTGKHTEPVTTGQIYWGAVPFVIIQCIMVALIIAFPQLVGHDPGLTEEQLNQEVDIQQILQDDAAADGSAEPKGEESQEELDQKAADDDDALTRALLENEEKK